MDEAKQFTLLVMPCGRRRSADDENRLGELGLMLKFPPMRCTTHAVHSIDKFTAHAFFVVVSWQLNIRIRLIASCFQMRFARIAEKHLPEVPASLLPQVPLAGRQCKQSFLCIQAIVTTFAPLAEVSCDETTAIVWRPLRPCVRVVSTDIRRLTACSNEPLDGNLFVHPFVLHELDFVTSCFRHLLWIKWSILDVVPSIPHFFIDLVVDPTSQEHICCGQYNRCLLRRPRPQDRDFSWWPWAAGREPPHLLLNAPCARARQRIQRKPQWSHRRWTR